MTNDQIELEARVREAGLVAMRQAVDGFNDRHAAFSLPPILISREELHALAKSFLVAAAQERARSGMELSALDRALVSA